MNRSLIAFGASGISHDRLLAIFRGDFDPDLGLVQVDTWTSAPDGYSTTATTKNGDCFAWVLRNGYVGASVPAVTYNATFYFGP